MRKVFKVLILILLFSAISLNAQAKTRIAYIEGGEFIDYTLILNGTVRGLEKLGLIANGNAENELPKNFTSQDLWAWLSKNAGGEEIEFLADGFYTANWDNDLQAKNKEAILERIRSKNDIDLIFAFGTVAGTDMATADHKVNVMNFSTTDPIGAGISKSAEDSGKDNVHAKIEPQRYIRQLALFHDIFNFDKMGICYEDTERGKATIGYHEIMEAAKLNNFEIVHGKIPAFGTDTDANLDLRIQCHQEIAPQVDAMYLTLGIANERYRIEELLEPFIKEKIPTFSQAGPQDVKQGVLLSMAQIDFDDMGFFEANTIAQIIDGKNPREISQIYQGRTDLALNLRMAMEIGWDLSFELLAAVDEIYKEIKNEDK